MRTIVGGLQPNQPERDVVDICIQRGLADPLLQPTVCFESLNSI